jgi:hypothetical protein
LHIVYSCVYSALSLKSSLREQRCLMFTTSLSMIRVVSWPLASCIAWIGWFLQMVIVVDFQYSGSYKGGPSGFPTLLRFEFFTMEDVCVFFSLKTVVFAGSTVPFAQSLRTTFERRNPLEYPVQRPLESHLYSCEAMQLLWTYSKR